MLDGSARIGRKSLTWQPRPRSRSLEAWANEPIRFPSGVGEGRWSMANPIKFRCFRCNQLLGVSRTKAGEVVSCPKCAAELIVPELEEVAQQLSAGPASAFESGGMAPSRAEPSASLENSPAIDILDIRPEDIRVEAGVVPVSPPPYTYKPPGSSEEPESSPEPAAGAQVRPRAPGGSSPEDRRRARDAPDPDPDPEPDYQVTPQPHCCRSLDRDR